MGNDTETTVNAPKTAQFTAKANGIIINGEIHLLAKSNSEEICRDCSLLSVCSDAFSMPCRLFTDEDDEHFKRFELCER